MMSLGQRPDVTGRNERKYGTLNSIYKSIPNTLRKQSSVDEESRASPLYMKHDTSRPSKTRIKSESGASLVQNHVEAYSKSPPESEEKGTSPRLKHRFTRNLSMTRNKRFNRRSMPSFKINEAGGLEQIDLPQAVIEGTHQNHDKTGQKAISPSKAISTSPNSLLNGTSFKPPKTPPPVPPRTSSRNIWNRTPVQKSEMTLTVASVRRVASFPESEAPESKQSAPSAFNFSPPLSPSAAQSLDNFSGPSPGSSPSGPSSPLYKTMGPGLSRKRSHVLRRKVSTEMIESLRMGRLKAIFPVMSVMRFEITKIQLRLIKTIVT